MLATNDGTKSVNVSRTQQQKELCQKAREPLDRTTTHRYCNTSYIQNS